MEESGTKLKILQNIIYNNLFNRRLSIKQRKDNLVKNGSGIVGGKSKKEEIYDYRRSICGLG